MIVEGKITDYKQGKPWESKHGKKFGNYIKVDAFKDGAEQILINSKTENPDFLQVGKTIKVDANEGDYGWYGKRITDNNFSGGAKKGGYKTKMVSFEEIKRICKQRAVESLTIINASNGKDVINLNDCNTIANFIIGDIRSETQDGSDRMGLLYLRAKCVTLSAKTSKDLQSLIDKANEYFKYVTS